MENTGKHLDHDGEVLFSEEGEDVTSEVASEWSAVQLAQKVEEKKHSKSKILLKIETKFIKQKLRESQDCWAPWYTLDYFDSHKQFSGHTQVDIDPA